MTISQAVATVLASAASGAVLACPAAISAYNATECAAGDAPAFYTGGSSAAVAGIGGGFGGDTCANPIITFQTVPAKQPAGLNTGTPATSPSTPDFRAYYCSATKGALATAGIASYTLYYRADGGSIVGAYAPLNNAQINELNLASAWCVADTAANTFDCATANNPTNTAQPAGTQQITGNDITNAPADGFTGAVAKHFIPYGVSDEEPGAYGNKLGEHWAGGGNDDAVNGAFGPPYPYTFLGADATPNQLQAMNHTLLFQQVFGFVANKGLGITDISSAALTAILSGTTTDWSHIMNDSTGNPVTAVATPIIVCQRDLGSGTRTGADIVFTGAGCNPYGVSGLALVDQHSKPNNFATADELLCVDQNATAIGYVSIDNFSKVAPVGTTYANTTALTLDGRSGTNKLAALGGWQYALEASFNTNAAYAKSAAETTFFNTLRAELQALNSAPATGHVNVLPGVGGNASNASAGHLQVSTAGKTYVASFNRDTTGGGNSCNMLNIH
jgi:hypothetical protein